MKARIKYKTAVLSSQGSRARVKNALTNSDEFIEPQDVRILSHNEGENTVLIIDPLDPERALVIAAEAVEIYNEAVGIWQTLVAFGRKIGAFFKRLFGKKQ